MILLQGGCSKDSCTFQKLPGTPVAIPQCHLSSGSVLTLPLIPSSPAELPPHFCPRLIPHLSWQQVQRSMRKKPKKALQGSELHLPGGTSPAGREGMGLPGNMDVPPMTSWGCGIYLSVLSAARQVGHEAANVLHRPFADVFQRRALLPIQKQTSHGAWIVRSRGGGKEGRRKEHKSLKSHTDNNQPAI